MRGRMGFMLALAGAAAIAMGCGDEGLAGGGGAAGGAGGSWNAGSQSAGCPADQTRCGNGCVNLKVSSEHCGRCFNDCGLGSCQNGLCICQGNLTDCGSGCVDTNTDSSNCGACGRICDAPLGCVGGVCGCPEGAIICGARCVHTATDVSHCGFCGNACFGGQLCEQGACVCPSGQRLCTEACVNTETDPANCGNCGNQCPGGETCSGGLCSGGMAGTSGNGGGAGGGGAGAGGEAAGGSTGQSEYPCDGDVSGYDAVVSLEDNTWVVRNGGSVVYSGGDMRAAMQAGIDSLTPGRRAKQSVLVQGSGRMGADTRVSVASYTILNVCGTIDVSGSGSGDMAPVYAREQTDIEVPNLTLTGSPPYGMFFRSVSNLHLGRIDMRLSGGLGIRIDSHGSGPANNIQIDDVYVQGTSNHGVETYGVDNLTIGTVVARNTGYCGLILNDTTNAEVGLVDAEGAGTGTGYAAFRMANRNGRVGNAYPTNIHVGQVIARGGARGIFCVSESGGAVIDRVDISNTGNNSILLENCYNVNIAAIEGSVTGGGDIRIAARDEFANSSDITIQNLTVTNSAINENPCGSGNMVFQNNTLVNSRLNVCN